VDSLRFRFEHEFQVKIGQSALQEMRQKIFTFTGPCTRAETRSLDAQWAAMERHRPDVLSVLTDPWNYEQIGLIIIKKTNRPNTMQAAAAACNAGMRRIH
jgi:hypothetical protein